MAELAGYCRRCGEGVLLVDGKVPKGCAVKPNWFCCQGCNCGDQFAEATEILDTQAILLQTAQKFDSTALFFLIQALHILPQLSASSVRLSSLAKKLSNNSPLMADTGFILILLLMPSTLK